MPRISAWVHEAVDPGNRLDADSLLDGHTDAEAAARLNEAGHRSTEGRPFTARIVLGLRRRRGLPVTPSACAPAAC